MSNKLILTINPGSTSTKLALFRDTELLFSTNTHIDADKIVGLKATDQLEMRLDSVYNFLNEHKINPENLDMIACRGGNLPGIGGGAYKVTQHMMNVVRYAPPQEHASNLGCLLGNALGNPYGKPVIIYDAPSTDEMEYYAKWTGIPEEPIVPANHVLNSRTVSRRVAREMGRGYEDCNFIVCHMGGGIGITAHKKGRIVDAVATDMGPMSPERAGRIPTNIMANLCYSGRYTKAEMKKYLLGGSGVLAWLGTQNMLEVENRAKAGEEKVVKVFYTMAYQTAKGIGELAAALGGKVDRVILTGGLAKADMFCDWIVELVDFIAPIARVPGEYEMEALAEGGLRVLEGLDVPKEYVVVPRGYKDMDAFYAAFPEMERVGV